MVRSLSIIVTWTQHIDQRRHFIQQHSQCIVIPFWSLTSLAGWFLKGINRGYLATMTSIIEKIQSQAAHACLRVCALDSAAFTQEWSDLKAAHGFVLHMHERMTSEVTGIVPPQVKIQSLSNPLCQRKVGWCFVAHKTFLELHSKTALQHSPKQLNDGYFSKGTWITLDTLGFLFFFALGAPRAKIVLIRRYVHAFLQGKIC